MNLKSHIHCVQKRMVGFGSLYFEIYKRCHINCGAFRLSYSDTFKELPEFCTSNFSVILFRVTFSGRWVGKKTSILWLSGVPV